MGKAQRGDRRRGERGIESAFGERDDDETRGSPKKERKEEEEEEEEEVLCWINRSPSQLGDPANFMDLRALPL